MAYYEDLEIDEYLILQEWKAQPGLFMSYAEESADAQKEVDDLKDKMDLLEAQISLEIREGTYTRTPPNIKMVEGTVSSLITTDPRLIDLKSAYNTAKRDAALMKKAEVAFEQRKKALENIVVIQGRQTFAEPRDKTDYITSVTDDYVIDKMTKKLNRGTK
jgi:hypothetical protein